MVALYSLILIKELKEMLMEHEALNENNLVCQSNSNS